MIGETGDLDQEGPKKKPKFELPDDYDSEAEFLADMRQDFYDDISADQLNRDAQMDDLRFLVGDQWDDAVRARREAARKPVLTINRLPAFIAQVVGNRRQSETDIKIVPDNGGTVDGARVREDLIRNIQKESRADVAFDTALEGGASCGLGNFQLEVAWETDDVFEKKMVISPIPDHMAVVWDRMLIDKTGRDAKHSFICDSMKRKKFQKLYPWASASDLITDVRLRGDMRMNGWIAQDDVRVVTYWRMRSTKRTLALMVDGTTLDITDTVADDEGMQIIANIMQRKDGTPIIREVDKPFCQGYLCSGVDILAGPVDLPISRVPVYRVPGWEVSVGEWRHRWGIIRFAKDPQRLHNYWRSILAEKIMQTPRAVWLAADNAVAGRENDYRMSHLTDNPLLIYSAEAGAKPERLMPAQVEDALLGQAEITSQDIKDVTNIHEANLGMPSNEVSGAAIMARQRVSDTGQIIYHDNLNAAMEECGRTMNELIPFIYDTPRIVKVMGPDAKQYMVEINKIGDGKSDITAGKYSVTAITGTSYATKRMESAQAMMALANAMPETLSLSADLIVEAQDWPQHEKLAKRIRKTLPPGILDPDEMTPDMVANAQAQSQAAQGQQQLLIQQTIAEWKKTEAQAAESAAKAANYTAQAQAVPAKVQNESVNTASQAADRELRGSLAAIDVAHTKD